jgi:hypothetical protein
VRAVALAYILLMPFMSALAPTEWTPLPLILLAMVTPVLLVRPSRVKLAFVLRRDWPFVLMFCCGVAGIWLSSLPSGGKNLNYSLAVLVCYFFFFCMVRRLVYEPAVSWEYIGRCCQWSLGVLSVGVVLEFYLASFHGLYFADIVHFAHKDLTVANHVTADFKRPRAFSAEPGFTALAYECLWPLTLLARRQRWWLHSLIAIAFLMLASAAGMACMLIALAIVWLAKGRDWRSALKFTLMIALVLGALLATEAGREAAWVVFGRKLDISNVAGVNNVDDAKTLLDRLNSYDISAILLMKHPLGVGWGTLGQAFADRLSIPDIGQLNGSGLLSLYLDIAVAAGVLGLLFWLLFVGWRARDLLVSQDPRARWVAIALISVGLHHLFITELQMPFLWFALALADKLVLDGRRSPRRQASMRQHVAARSDHLRPSTGLG